MDIPPMQVEVNENEDTEWYVTLARLPVTSLAQLPPHFLITNWTLPPSRTGMTSSVNMA